MPSIGSLVKPVFKRLARSLGYELVNLRHRWGVNCYADMKRLIDPSAVRVIFDVGANLGKSALEYHREFPRAQITCFEPVPHVFDRLKANTCRYSAIRPVPIALGEQSGKQTIYLCGDNHPVSSLLPEHPYMSQFAEVPARRELQITVSSMDEFCRGKQLEQIDILKVDVEGYELSVFKGAAEMLREGRTKLVYCEFHHLEGPPGKGSVLVNIASVLTGNGFALAGLYTDSVLPSHRCLAVRNALFVHTDTLKSRHVRG